MGFIVCNTNTFGVVTVQDVMVNCTDTNMYEGIDIFDENHNLLCELTGYSSDDFIDDQEVEDLLLQHIN